MVLRRALFALFAFGCFGRAAGGQLVPRAVSYAPGKSITLAAPAGFDVHVVATGMPRVRFFAKSPFPRANSRKN